MLLGLRARSLLRIVEKMDKNTLAQLIGRVALKDRLAFDKIYEDMSSLVFGICLQILNDRSEAEDALQESFIKLWEKAETFSRVDASSTAWLASIARNASIDRLRRRRSVPLDTSHFDDLEDPDDSPEDSLVQEDDAHRLHRCLGELEPPQASVVRTAFFAGQSYADLAKSTYTPLGTIKSWVRRSLIKLRTCLEHGAAGARP